MIIDNTDLKTISEISLISGVSTENIEKTMEALQSYLVFQYSKDNKRINIPYIGNIMIKYLDDVETPEGKEADLDIFFSPHSQLKHIIGQLKDIENSGDPKDLDVYKSIRKTIKRDFKTKLADDELK